jgi:Tol biopolymer transport system component
MRPASAKLRPTKALLGSWASIVLIVGAVSFHPEIQTSFNESVRDELARMQKQTGLTLASYSQNEGLQLVLFDKRTFLHGAIPGRSVYGASLSRDGTEIAARQFTLHDGFSLLLARSYGSNLREYRDIHPVEICWSHDGSKLAMTAAARTSMTSALQIMDLGSNTVGEIAPTVTRLTSQCWSPDGKRIVSEGSDGIRIDEIGNAKSFVLFARGQYPTWSSDGLWIAFLDHDTYYAIHPDGQGKKRLFHQHHAFTPLYWSPDSRMVAYEAILGFFEGRALYI